MRRSASLLPADESDAATSAGAKSSSPARNMGCSATNVPSRRTAPLLGRRLGATAIAIKVYCDGEYRSIDPCQAGGCLRSARKTVRFGGGAICPRQAVPACYPRILVKITDGATFAIDKGKREGIVCSRAGSGGARWPEARLQWTRGSAGCRGFWRGFFLPQQRRLRRAVFS